MSTQTYYEKLKDPRWQKLRLKVMENADFHCQVCGDGSSPLNVHHKEYFKGHEPWEYDDKHLVCMCESCHESYHEQFNYLRWACAFLPLDGPDNRDDATVLLAGFIGIDYEGLLSFTGFEDCPPYRKLWELGRKARYYEMV